MPPKIPGNAAEHILAMQEAPDFGDLKKQVKIWQYGDFGSWKTTTACRIGTPGGKTLLYTANRDDTSLHNHRDLFGNEEGKRSVRVIRYDSVRQIDVLADMLLEKEKYFPDIETFVWDTVSGWCKKFVYDMAQKTKFGDNSRTVIKPRPGVPGAADFITELDLVSPELTDYNILQHRLQPIMEKLLKVDCNVILNAHVRSVQAGKAKYTAIAHYRPNVPEAVFDNTAQDCDAVLIFQKTNSGTPVVKTSHGDIVQTKSRIGALTNRTFKGPNEYVKVLNDYLAS